MAAGESAEPGKGGEDTSAGAEVGEASGVSDFGISARLWPARVAERRPVPAARSGESVGADVPDAPEAPDAPETADPRFEVSSALRRIVAAVVGRPLPDTALSETAAELEAMAERLESAAGPGRRPRPQPDPTRHPQDFFPTSPVIGFANPIAPPVTVEMDGTGGLQGSAWFDYQYEGPPTCVHGGVIALVFDELLGAANIAAGCPGMTGTLTIRYRKPTPLRTPLRLEARWTGREGRKITTRGAIYRDAELLAEAEGIFIELVPERFLRILSANAGNPDGAPSP